MAKRLSPKTSPKAASAASAVDSAVPSRRESAGSNPYRDNIPPRRPPLPPARLAAGLIVLLAAFFLVRAVAWSEFSRTVFYTQPLLDAEYYDQLARRVGEGRWQQDQAFFMGPGYPYILGMAYGVFGPDPWVGRALNLAWSLLSFGLIFWLGRRLEGWTAAFGGAALWSLYRPAIFFEQTLLMEVMAGALGLASVALAVAWFGNLAPCDSAVPKAAAGEDACATSRRPILGAFLCGLALGIAALARANVLAFAPFLAGWILWRLIQMRQTGSSRHFISHEPFHTRPPVRLALAVGVFGFGVAVAVSPVAIHNARAERDFVPITSNAGINLYIGNNPESRGYFLVPPGMNTEHDPRGKRIAARALRNPNPSSREISSWWGDRAKAWIRENPGGFLLNTLRKLALLFTAGEIPQIYHQEAMAESLPFLRWPLATFLLLCPLAAVGFVCGLRRASPARGDVALLLFHIAAVGASLLPFFVTGRYRLPTIPAACVAGGLGIAALIEMARGRDFRRLAAHGLLALGFVAAAFAIGRMEPRDPTDISEFESMRGAILIRAGRIDEAQSVLERRAAIAPTPGIWSNLGMIYETRPEGLTKAAEAYEKAAKLNPADARIWFNLSQVLLRLNRRAEGRAALERTLALDPDVQPLAWYNLALLRNGAGDRKGARVAVEEYLKRQPKDPEALGLLKTLSID